MGLDMYLTGEKYVFQNRGNPGSDQYEDGYRLKSRRFALGYWRKHPDLHGFIVENSGERVDDCRPVYLDSEDLKQIITAVMGNQLPHTEGFFFGESDNDEEQRTEAIQILSGALQWLQMDEVHRSVFYQASW